MSTKLTRQPTLALCMCNQLHTSIGTTRICSRQASRLAGGCIDSQVVYGLYYVMAEGREHSVGISGPSSRPARAISVFAPHRWHGTACTPWAYVREKGGERERELKPSIGRRTTAGVRGTTLFHMYCVHAWWFLLAPACSVQQLRPFVVSGASHLGHADFQFPIAPAPQHPCRKEVICVIDHGNMHGNPPTCHWPDGRVELPAALPRMQSSDMAKCFDAELPPLPGNATTSVNL